ncbi:MAG TPA: dTMP kinase [Firmicutes bacterium]|jgi:dTMP kinase|nr:dTMP kinase [Bacillota bacterium]HCX79187.1 dTMP kinase [Bacillota bacterium]
MVRSNLKGRFIVFEGLDGCGKTTQAKMLSDFLSSQGVQYLHVREPGGTAVGNKLREILLNPETVLTRWGEVLLLAAARAQLVQDVIRPALARGEIVVCDRYLFSSLAYQGYGLEQNVELVRQVNLEAVGGLMPDWTFLLDIEPEAGLSRQANRRGLDRIEQRKEGFFQRVVEGYQQLAKDYGLIRLDGTASVQAIHRQVVTILGKKLILREECGDE